MRKYAVLREHFNIDNFRKLLHFESCCIQMYEQFSLSIYICERIMMRFIKISFEYYMRTKHNVRKLDNEGTLALLRDSCI